MHQPITRSRLGRVAVTWSLVALAACGGGAQTDESSDGTSAATPAAQIETGSAPVPSASPRRTTSPSAHAVADLGPRLLATIDGVVKPCAMVATATDVWVTGNGPSVLARIDPVTNAILSQTPMDGSPCGIALGSDGRLWVALLSAGQVVAVDPITGAVGATIDGLGGQLWDLKAGFEAIWVVDRSRHELLRVDPTTAAVTAQIPIGRSGSGLAIAAGAVWVLDDAEGSVRRVDPATNAVTDTVTLPRGSSWFANDDRTLLVANRLDGAITPIDATDGTPGAPIEGSRSPLDGTVGGGVAYIPDGRAGTLVELDVGDLMITAVDRLEGARNPFVAEVAFDDVWVLDYGGERMWRISR
jgi:hypothetical protein